MTSVGWLSSSGLGRPTGPGKYHDCAAKQVRTETSRPATSPQMPCGATLVKCPQGSNSFVLNASFLMRGGANPSCPRLSGAPPAPARFYWSSSRCRCPANLHECIGVERVAECDRPGRIGIEGDNRFAPRGLVMAFQAAWMGYSALMWGTEVGCVRSPYEANPRGQSWR